MEYRNRQTFIGLLVRPKQQARIAVVFALGTLATHLVLYIALYLSIEQLDSFSLAMYLITSAFFLTGYALITGVILNHRLFGPFISIKRHIAHLREGQYSSRLQLRETDDMSEIRDALNDLAQALEQRHGPGKTPS